MRILAFNEAFWPQVGGIERFLLQLSAHLHERHIEVVVAARTPHNGPNPFPFRVYWQPSEQKLRELVDWCDILHLNAMHVGLLLRAAWKRKKIVTTNHDVTLICPKGTKIRYDGPCTNRAGPIICMHCLKRSGTPRPWRMLVRPPIKGLLSALTHASVLTSPWAMRRFKILRKRLIPLGTDVECFSPGSAWPRLHEPDRLPRVIYVGRVIFFKGTQVLIEALRLCRAAGHPFELLICGDGPYMPHLQSAVEKHDLKSLVAFLGFTPDDRLVATLRSADVAVVPSLGDEPFGYAAIEAMACGLPVIAADTGALGSIVGELGSDMIFERGNAGQLAERLQLLLADPVRRRARAEAARRLVQEKYDVSRMLRAYDDLYASLVGAHRYPPASNSPSAERQHRAKASSKARSHGAGYDSQASN